MNTPFKALELHRVASSDKCRPALNTVRFDRIDATHVASATDGHLLGIVRWSDPQSNGGFPSVNVPVSVAKNALRSKAEDFTIEREDKDDEEVKGKAYVVRSQDGQSHSFRDGELGFPDAEEGERIIQRAEVIATALLNPHILRQAAEAIFRLSAPGEKSPQVELILRRREPSLPGDKTDPKRANIALELKAHKGEDGVESSIYLMPLVCEDDV